MQQDDVDLTQDDVDLTQVVTSALESRGVLAKMRAELRANVFSAIHEGQGGKQVQPSAPLRLLQAEPAGRLAASLVLELLQVCELDYSASVLVPEARMEDVADRAALTKILGLSPTPADEPLLVQLLRSRMAGGGPPTPRPTAALKFPRQNCEC